MFYFFLYMYVHPQNLLQFVCVYPHVWCVRNKLLLFILLLFFIQRTFLNCYNCILFVLLIWEQQKKKQHNIQSFCHMKILVKWMLKAIKCFNGAKGISCPRHTKRTPKSHKIKYNKTKTQSVKYVACELCRKYIYIYIYD